MIYSSALDKSVVQWDSSLNGLQKWTPSQTEATTALLCFGSLSQQTLVATATSKIKCFDAQTLKVAQKYSGHTSHIKFLKISSDRKVMLSGGGERFVAAFILDQDLTTPTQG
jgi:WD40 repeat protein